MLISLNNYDKQVNDYTTMYLAVRTPATSFTIRRYLALILIGNAKDASWNDRSIIQQGAAWTTQHPNNEMQFPP